MFYWNSACDHIFIKSHYVFLFSPYYLWCLPAFTLSPLFPLKSIFFRRLQIFSIQLSDLFLLKWFQLGVEISHILFNFKNMAIAFKTYCFTRHCRVFIHIWGIFIFLNQLLKCSCSPGRRKVRWKIWFENSILVEFKGQTIREFFVIS